MLEKPVSMFKTFLDVVLPPICYICEKACSSKYGLCESCLGKIRRIPPPQCTRCARHIRLGESICNECKDRELFLERNWSPCYYEGAIKESIHLFKYNGYLGLSDIFSDIMVDFIKQNHTDEAIELIVPVPIYQTTKRERTYNHAEILARRVAKRLGILIDTKNLKKIKWTQSQSELEKKKRLINVKDAFLVVDKSVFSRKNVLIVDDVYTTGATLNECAKVLLQAGAKKVFSLTLARGI